MQVLVYIPHNFRDNLEQLFNDMYVNRKQIETDIDKIISELEKIIPDKVWEK